MARSESNGDPLWFDLHGSQQSNDFYQALPVCSLFTFWRLAIGNLQFAIEKLQFAICN